MQDSFPAASWCDGGYNFARSVSKAGDPICHSDVPSGRASIQSTITSCAVAPSLSQRGAFGSPGACWTGGSVCSMAHAFRKDTLEQFHFWRDPVRVYVIGTAVWPIHVNNLFVS